MAAIFSPLALIQQGYWRLWAAIYALCSSRSLSTFGFLGLDYLPHPPPDGVTLYPKVSSLKAVE